MACKCLDNLKLSIDSIEKLSIDEIINLYKQGYTIDYPEIDYPEATLNIKTLAYSDSCTGTPTLDIYRATSQTGGFVIYKGYAMAQKIVPTSRCLDFVLFNNVKRYGNYSMHFEIRQDSSGSPSGTPGSSTGRIVDILVPYGNIPTTYGPMTVDFLTILPAANVPYWIVVYPSDYACNSATSGTGYERMEFSRSYTSATERAAYVDMAPCRWQSLSGDAWAMEVYKLPTYTTPSVANVYNVCWGSGLGAICSIPPQQPVIPVGTNFPIKADITNSGGTGKVRAVFKANNVTISDQNTPSLATFTGTQYWSPTVNYTMPSTDVTLTIEGYGWNGAWVLTNTQTTTISKSIPTCTGISIDASTITANIGDIITLTAYGITPTTQPYTVTFTDRSNTVLGTCISSNGTCSINWNTTGLSPGTYYVKASVIGQCISTELAIGLSMPIIQWDVDLYVSDSVTTNPISGASITIGTQTLLTDSNGFRRFRVDQGTINVTITKTGYNTIGPDPQYIYNNTTLNYNMVSISQNPGHLRFITSPPGISGAAVHFIGDIPTLKGTTDINGMLTISSLTAGRIVNYQVIKTGYNTATGSATVVGNVTTDVLVTMTLTSTTGSVCIHSSPSGASIKIDNTIQIGKLTALSGGGCVGANTIDNLSSGNHNYELSLTGYQNKTGSFSITVGQTLDYNAGTLTPLPTLGTLNISSVPEGARIYLMTDGIYQDTEYVTGTPSSPTVITTLTAGTYSYKLTKIGYQDYINVFNITAGQTTIVSPTLTLSAPTKGSLSIASGPQGAEIYIEIGGTFQDMLYITGPIGNPTVLSNLEEGSYRYKLTYPDYQDAIGNFTITAGQVTGPINVTMSKPSAGEGGGIVFGLIGIAALAMMLSSK